MGAFCKFQLKSAVIVKIFATILALLVPPASKTISLNNSFFNLSTERFLQIYLFFKTYYINANPLNPVMPTTVLLRLNFNYKS